MGFVGGKQRDYAPWKCSKIGGVNKINQTFEPRYMYQFINSYTKTWLNARVFNYKKNLENMHLNKNNIYVQEI